MSRRHGPHPVQLLVGLAVVLVAETRVFRIGYISGSKRAPDQANDMYDRPGYQISGAISLAVAQINQHHPDGLLINHTLEFEYGETFGSEDESLKITARFLERNVSAIIGPQETCVHEARLAAAYKTLMLSYFCRQRFQNQLPHQTFINVRPHETAIASSVVSLLLKYNWKTVTLVYKSSPEEYLQVVEVIRDLSASHGIDAQQSRTWADQYYLGFDEEIVSSPFYSIVEQTKNNTKTYVVVGDNDAQVGFMNAMEDQQLLDSGDYTVVGVYPDRYKSDRPDVYLRGIFESTVTEKSIKAFRSFLGVTPSPITKLGYFEFTGLVNEWQRRPPFNFNWSPEVQKTIRIEATYLHDAVFLYARALTECLNNPADCPDPLDGRKLVKYILDRPYNSATGHASHIDSSGTSLGSYSILALQKNATSGQAGLIEIGSFQLNNNGSLLPNLVLRANQDIAWPRGYAAVPEGPS